MPALPNLLGANRTDRPYPFSCKRNRTQENKMNYHTPPHPDDKLQRGDLAVELSKAGYPTKKATLSTLASRFGGPPFSKYGKWPLYRWGDALAWAKARETPPRCSTSEHRAVSL
jgi:hypothetical protein